MATRGRQAHLGHAVFRPSIHAFLASHVTWGTVFVFGVETLAIPLLLRDNPSGVGEEERNDAEWVTLAFSLDQRFRFPLRRRRRQKLACLQ